LLCALPSRESPKAELIRVTLGDVASGPARVKPRAVALVKDGKSSIARDLDDYLAETGFGEWRWSSTPRSSSPSPSASKPPASPLSITGISAI